MNFDFSQRSFESGIKITTLVLYTDAFRYASESSY